MTSASELFYQRRSRTGRPTGFDPVEPSPFDRQNYNRRHHNHNHHHNRLESDGCDPLRRSPQPRSHLRPSTPSERGSAWVDSGSTPLVTSGGITPAESLGNTSTSRGRSRLTSSERLPGAVLLARARLLERLRGVSISGNRRSSRASFGIYNREYTFGDDLRVIDAGDWGTAISPGRSSETSPFTAPNLQTDRPPSLGGASKSKPPGLTPEALDHLQFEVFREVDNDLEDDVLQVSRDCTICLENFIEGDELIRLPCNHSFHHTCLDPWVRTCGECPNCRRDIVVCSHIQ